MCQAYDAEWQSITSAEQRRSEVCGYGDCARCGQPAREHGPYFPYRAVIDNTTVPWTWCEGFKKKKNA